jgi:hypothetical protein
MCLALRAGDIVPFMFSMVKTVALSGWRFLPAPRLDSGILSGGCRNRSPPFVLSPCRPETEFCVWPRALTGKASCAFRSSPVL